jgi:cystathionine beta-lyase/cystathionine gamma-synthase
VFTPESFVDNEKSIRSGTLVAFSVPGGWDGATKFIHALRDTIPFCPSLGELNTTLSHPASTSHRAFSPADRQAIGIDDGLIRLSVGTESGETICKNLAAGLAAC